MRDILVKFQHDGDFVSLTTTDREHGKSPRFIISREKLRAGLWADEEAVVDFDLNNIVRIVKDTDGETVRIRLWWMQVDGRGRISGYQQNITVPWKVMREALDAYKVTYLASTSEPMPRVHFAESAQRQIGELTDKQRNALRKFLRNAFAWPGSDGIEVFADWGRDFYFKERNGINGGICWSEYSGKYSLHT